MRGSCRSLASDQLLSHSGLRQSTSGLAPRPWLGTETVARMLGFRINHPREQDAPRAPGLAAGDTRAEAAYSFAVYLDLDPRRSTQSGSEAERLLAPGSHRLAADRRRARAAVRRTHRTSGRVRPSVPQQPCSARRSPAASTARVSSGGCTSSRRSPPRPSSLAVLGGRTSYAMSGEVRSLGADSRARRCSPATSSSSASAGLGRLRARSATWASTSGTAGSCTRRASARRSTSMTGWYEKTFAWGRSPLRRSRPRVLTLASHEP